MFSYNWNRVVQAYIHTLHYIEATVYNQTFVLRHYKARASVIADNVSGLLDVVSQSSLYDLLLSLSLTHTHRQFEVSIILSRVLNS